MFGILVFGSLFAGSLGFFVFYLFLLVLSLLEFYRLAGKKNNDIQKYPGLIAAVVLFILFFGYSAGYITERWLAAMVIFPVAMMIGELYRKKERPFNNLAWTFCGIIYVGLPLSLLNFLVFPGEVASYHYYPGIPAGVFMMIMINDTVAYLVGVPLGRKRLFERVSPKKSWEGTIAGALVVVLAALFMNRLFPLINSFQWFVVALIVTVTGVYGDLVESLFKRELGIKDSGSLLPGHGGILDRIDAWFFVIPLVWFFFSLIK